MNIMEKVESSHIRLKIEHSDAPTCEQLPKLLQSFDMYRPIVQVVQRDNLPHPIEKDGEHALRINTRIHTWVKPKNMSEMMHSGGPEELSPLEGFERTVGDSVVISRPTMSLNISTLLRIQNLTISIVTGSTPSSMGRSNGMGLMLGCAASSSLLLKWESVVCGAMKLTTTPSLAKHLAKMMKGVLCPAAGKGNTTTCTPMGGGAAITSIATFLLHNHNQEIKTEVVVFSINSSTQESDMDTLRPMTLLKLTQLQWDSHGQRKELNWKTYSTH